METCRRRLCLSPFSFSPASPGEASPKPICILWLRLGGRVGPSCSPRERCTHLMLPLLVAYRRCLQMCSNISLAVEQLRASKTCTQPTQPRPSRTVRTEVPGLIRS